MNKNSQKSYPPNERDYLEEGPKNIESISKNGKSSTMLPNPKVDPIVSNNIATSEFDYTDSLFKEEQD